MDTTHYKKEEIVLIIRKILTVLIIRKILTKNMYGFGLDFDSF